LSYAEAVPVLAEATSVGTGTAIDLHRVHSDHAGQFVFEATSGGEHDEIQAGLEGSLDGVNWYGLVLFFSAGEGHPGMPFVSSVGPLVVTTGRPARYLRGRVYSLVGTASVSLIVASRA
jgi:hypothetical protein